MYMKMYLIFYVHMFGVMKRYSIHVQLLVSEGRLCPKELIGYVQ
jgi:hypothetical protein